MSEQFTKISNAGDSHGDSSLLFNTNPSELSSSSSFHTYRSSSFFGLSTTQHQNKKGLFSPLAMIIVLSFVSIFILFTVLGSKTMGYNSVHSGAMLSINSYRRLQEDFWSFDLRAGGIFGLGAIHPKELQFCPRIMEHFVPCYNTSLARKAGLENDDDILFDRNCEASGSAWHCLIRTPKNYHVPVRWPHSRETVYAGNLKTLHDELREAKVERILLSDDNMLTFMISNDVDGVEAHFQEIASILGIPDDSSFRQLGIQKVLDIGCSHGSYLAYLLSRNFTSLCVAPYQEEDQVQVTLDRGLPAMIGSLVTKQFPFPEASFNMIHCADCAIDWSKRDGLFLFEVDRLLSPDGFFVWTMSSEKIATEKMLQSIDNVARSICWTPISNKYSAIVWRKTSGTVCTRQSSSAYVHCDDNDEERINIPYQDLRRCVRISKDSQQKLYLPSVIPGFLSEEISDNPVAWRRMLKSYWTSITPLLFSDHPKRPGEDDPLPPFNIFRNVMDMNALFGGFNAALLEAGKSVWVMNVVPTSGPNTLPMIYNRGYIGALHNWCEAFPSYPRTYDLLHAVGLISQLAEQGSRCSLANLFLEMDRLLRPEGWVLIRDRAELIREARLAAYQMRWEGRIIEVDGNDSLRLLVCQKVFWKR